jgi:acetamidase/formamidase
MDVRQLIAGSRVYFPVFNRGALFSVGDGHAAQGDGEVCGYAIEIAAEFSCKFIIHKDLNLSKPRAIIPPQHSSSDGGGYYLTMGIDSDAKKAVREAVKEMIDWMVRDHDLSIRDALIAASVAGDVKISEAVNLPNWIASFQLPKSIFETTQSR